MKNLKDLKERFQLAGIFVVVWLFILIFAEWVRTTT